MSDAASVSSDTQPSATTVAGSFFGVVASSWRRGGAVVTARVGVGSLLQVERGGLVDMQATERRGIVFLGLSALPCGRPRPCHGLDPTLRKDVSRDLGGPELRPEMLYTSTQTQRRARCTSPTW